jgi:predicted alpha/beta-hydrolase family hydrolase
MPQGKQDEIQGYRNNALPISVWEQPNQADLAALVFPGLGYHADLPVLYYAALQLYSMGADVLRLRFPYDQQPGFMQQPDQAIVDWLRTDASAILDYAQHRHAYAQTTLIGKSLGTIALAALLAHRADLSQAACLWLTPVLTNPLVVRQLRETSIPGLVVIGSADPYYNVALVDELARKPNLRCVVIPGADHGLEIAGDALASVQAMGKMVEGIQALIGH